MKKEMFETKIAVIGKGRLTKAVWKSVKTKGENVVEKISSGVVRLGIKYSNLKSNKDIVTKELPYGTYAIQDYLIEHNGNYQVRLYPSVCKNHRVFVEYLLNGKPTTKQELIAMGLVDNKPSKARTCFNVKLENLISLG